MDRRIHFLDQVRSHMMLLGLVLHAAGSYNNLPAGELWPYKSADTHLFYSIVINIIHSFRMQVFFIVAGLFAAMLLSRRGAVRFVGNRLLRVVFPFLLFVGPVVLVCNELFQYGADLMGQRGIAIPFSDGPSLYHLWFLYYLSFYVFLAIPVHWVFERIFTSGYHRLLSVLLPWVLASAVALIHIMNGSYLLPAPLGLGVLNEVFLHYFIYFVAGMAAYQLKDAFFSGLDHWGRWLLMMFVALLLFVASVMLNSSPEGGTANSFVWYGALLLGVYYTSACWFVFSIYKRLCNQFSRVSRYLSESSYWVYIIHLPLTVLLPMLIESWPLYHGLKFMFVLVVTFALSIVTYHLLVRSTVLGWLLNGKRYPFHLPVLRLRRSIQDGEQAV